MSGPAHGAAEPSAWIRRWSGVATPGAAVLDVACGLGRHSRWFAERGHPVTALDRDPAVATAVGALAGVTFLEADLEAGPWPLPSRRFGAVVVTNYLHRPLMPAIVDSVAPGGVLLYETFAAGNARFGKPSNPAFLLEPGELLEAVRGRLRVIAYEDLEVAEPRPAMIQRICAVSLPEPAARR